jgi:CDP-diacylglycerol---serine O-phosphatidyltransferase
MRPIRTIAILPTLFTLGNLVCGFFAIAIASRVAAPHSVQMNPDDVVNCAKGAVLIFVAMLFDALDGYVARLSHTSSDFGAQLDSLCDLVTFGVAPGFLVVKMCPEFAFLYREAAWVIAAAYVACAAIRLARFNVETDDDDEHLNFSGLPSPAGAAAIASFAIIFYTLRIHEEQALRHANEIKQVLQYVLPLFAVLVALLMVSRIPYPHVVNQIFRGQRSFGHLVAVIFAFVVIMMIPSYSVPIICCLFVFYGPARFCWEKVVQRRHQEESLF